jgi:hypothetical protein
VEEVLSQTYLILEAPFADTISPASPAIGVTHRTYVIGDLHAIQPRRRVNRTNSLAYFLCVFTNLKETGFWLHIALAKLSVQLSLDEAI